MPISDHDPLELGKYYLTVIFLLFFNKNVYISKEDVSHDF